MTDVKTIIDKISDKKDSSFWYFDYEIPYIPLKGNKKLVLESRGGIELYFDENGEKFKNDNAVKEAIDRDYTDNDLAKINEFDGWIHNNWFAVVIIDENDNVISDDLGIAHGYDEGIEILKEVHKTLK